MELPGLDEPVGLQARAATDPDAVKTQIASGRLIVAPLWKAWGPVLDPAGIDRATLSAILRGYGYEVWLWAAGERTWAQCLEGLAGRVSRRLGTRPPAKKTRAATTARTAKKARPLTRGRTPAKARRPSKARTLAKARRPSKARTLAKAPGATKVAKTRRATTATRATKATKATKARRPTVTGTKARTARTARKADGARPVKSSGRAAKTSAARKTRRR